MTNQAILTKAIQKAIDGGWVPFVSKDKQTVDYNISVGEDGANIKLIHPKSESRWCWFPAYELIFNHDFAKALWGNLEFDEWLSHDVPAKRPDFRPWNNGFKDWADIPEYYWYCVNCKMPWRNTFDTKCEKVKHGNMGWQYHLQQMVIADDPIKYLGENI